MTNRDCGRWQDALPDYVAGRLRPEAARAVAAHLEACSECRDEAALVTALFAPARAPAGLAERVLTAVQAGPRPRVSHTRRYALAATVAFALISGSLLWRQAGQNEGGETVAIEPGVIEPAESLLRDPGLYALSEEELLALLEEMGT